MSHDKTVMYIETELKSALVPSAREQLLAYHYQAVHNARQAGVREGQREVLMFKQDVALSIEEEPAISVPGMPPTPPLARDVCPHDPREVWFEETFPKPAKSLLVIFGVIIVALATYAIFFAGN